MWQYVFISITSLLCLCLIIITSNKSIDNLLTSTSIKVNLILDKRLESFGGQNLKRQETSTPSPRSQIRRKIHIPKFMLDLYEERKNENVDLNPSRPDIVRSVIPKDAGTLQNKNVFQSLEENHILIFDIPSTNKDETFFNAELRVLTLIDPDSGVAGVERFVKLSLYEEPSRKLQVLEERHVYHSENTWMRFNMTQPVGRLLNKTSSKRKFLKLIISVKAFVPFLNYESNYFKLSLLPITDSIEHDYPILLLFYMAQSSLPQKPIRRSKRNVEEDYEEETNRIWDNEQLNKAQAKKLKRLKNTCKRKQLYIDFAEIQYDTWIVQPSGYEAYQCTGKCFYPVAEHLSPTKHAIVQALMHSVAPSKATRSCCVPVKLDSISLLYVDDKGVLTYRFGYNDMVVTECGCR